MADLPEKQSDSLPRRHSSMISAQRRVVLAVDGSDNSKHAFEKFITKYYKIGDEIIIAHIAELPKMPAVHLSSSGAQMPIEVWAKRASERQQKSEMLLSFYEKECINRKIRRVIVARYGPNKPADEIIQIATEYKAAYIVAGTRGLGTLKRALLGSVSEEIVRLSKCPVMIIHKN